MRKVVLLVVYTGESRGQNMVLCFCKQFLFYFRIIVYIISKIVPKSVVMICGVILEIFSVFFLSEVHHFQSAQLYNCHTTSAECIKTFTYLIDSYQSTP